jgi:SAM-dependent methyltransferase
MAAVLGSAGNQFDGVSGAVYDRYIQSPVLSAVFGRLQWGSDARAMRAHMERSVRSVPAGATVVDVPCGGGLLLRWLDPGFAGRWLAVDLSRTMLARTDRLGVAGVETVLADASELPVHDGTADVVMAYNGLHHFADAPGSLREAMRVLRPHGSLHGCMLVEGERAASDRLIAVYRRLGWFGPAGTASDLERWLVDAGFTDVVVESDGAIATFDGRPR